MQARSIRAARRDFKRLVRLDFGRGGALASLLFLPPYFMPTIRDLVNVLRRRDGVEAAVVLGRDGLLIDGQVVGSVDVERVAAHVAPILQAADEFGAAATRGALTTAILEHPRGVAIVSALSAEAVLLVLLAPDAAIGPLLHELRRNREHMAALV